MLKKRYKLNSVEHKKVLKKGKRVHSKFFTVSYLVVGTPETKCSLVIPKRIYKKASKRNEIKRKIAVLLREIYPQLSGSLHIVVSLRSDLAELETNSLLSELLSSMKTLCN